MRTETAESLVLALGNTLTVALDAQNKIMALETVLKRERPELYQEYLKELEVVRKNPPRSVDLEGLMSLQQKLVDEGRTK